MCKFVIIALIFSITIIANGNNKHIFRSHSIKFSSSKLSVEKESLLTKQINNVKQNKNGESAKYKLKIKLANGKIHLGEKIVLQITLKNNSSEIVLISGTASHYGDTKIEIKNLVGKIPDISEKGRKALNLDGLMGRMQTEINPGEETYYEIYLHELYDLQIGSYTIIISRRVFTKDNKTFMLKTNKVKLVVRK